MYKTEKLRLLMELRPCVEGFAGIPQETRLLFAAYQQLEALEVHGLINHPLRWLSKALQPKRSYDTASQHKKYNVLSRFVVSQQAPLPGGRWGRGVQSAQREWQAFQLGVQASLGVAMPLYEFDARQFAEFVWEAFFAKTLPSSQFSAMAEASYLTLRSPWRAMHKSGMRAGGWSGRRYPRIDTRGFDVFLTQTPYPGEVHPSTQMVVRYHDAIPMFLPQIISAMKFHRASHYATLRENARHAVFVCTSEAVRSDLLHLFPALERRSAVIPDVVSESYFRAPTTAQKASEVIRNRLNDRTQPGLTARERTSFYDLHLKADELRFVMMVSTIEPRKNHLRMIQAWEQIRYSDPDLKLIVVGELGWDVERIVEAMTPWQQRGQLFHLSRLPSSDLRILYSFAECVICPSIAEGFDLSGVEAMLCGVTVVASDIPPHREVYGDAAIYFDRYSTGQLADCLQKMLHPENAAQRESMREWGLKRAERYKQTAILPQWAEFFGAIAAGNYHRP